MKQSKGHIKIYSELGRGTVVKLYLPRLYGEVSDDRAESAESDIPHRGQGELILVVEDDEAVRSYSTDTLREFGYRVITASEGRTALGLLARHRDIRLLFTDIGLPGGMNGRQVAELARQQRPDLKILFTTGYAGNALLHAGILDHGTNLLPKPFTHAALGAKIRSLLGGTQ
jgi:CheY-like chemotaxis protein